MNETIQPPGMSDARRRAGGRYGCGGVGPRGHAVMKARDDAMPAAIARRDRLTPYAPPVLRTA